MKPGPGYTDVLQGLAGFTPEMPLSTWEVSNRCQSSLGICLDPHTLLAQSRKASMAPLLSHGDETQGQRQVLSERPPAQFLESELRKRMLLP